MTWKRPQGFALRDNIVSDATTWKRILQGFCQQLSSIDPQRFRELPTNNSFISKRGNARFSKSPDGMISPLAVPDGLFVESNLSAIHICDSIRKLLNEFSIGVNELNI